MNDIQENADRAAQSQSPLEFEDIERTAKSILEDNSLPTQVLGVIEKKTEKSRFDTLVAELSSVKSLLQVQGGRRGGGVQGEGKGPTATFQNIGQQRVNGLRICHRYNRAGGCSREGIT